MEKKSLFIVTQTIVGLVSHSIDTYIIGYSESKDIAEGILRDEHDRMVKLGYDMLFKHTGWEMSYKSEYVVCKYQIKIAFSL